MGWLGDSSHRGQGCQAWTAVGLPPRYPLSTQEVSTSAKNGNEHITLHNITNRWPLIVTSLKPNHQRSSTLNDHTTPPTAPSVTVWRSVHTSPPPLLSQLWQMDAEWWRGADSASQMLSKHELYQPRLSRPYALVPYVSTWIISNFTVSMIVSICDKPTENS